MTLPTILVCDDDEGRRNEWSRELKVTDGIAGNFDIEVLGSDFLDEFRLLRNRRLAAREGSTVTRPATPSRLDHTAVLVVDFDLAWFEQTETDAADAYLTGEILCYLARCYSSVGAIVGVNQFGPNPFNLELQDPLSSFADINVGEQQLANPGLWGGPWRGFRPWAWPNVAALPGLLEERSRDVNARLGEDPLEFLGLPKEEAATLPRALLTDLETGRADETLLDVAERSPIGLRGGDRLDDEAAAGRLLAARLGKWIEHRLVPAQGPLIDAPHLVQRNAALLGERATETDAWQEVCRLDARASSLLVDRLAAHSWPRSQWASRPLWRLDAVLGDEELPGVRDPWDIPDVDLVFCEDISRFLPRDRARSFVIELPTATPARYLADPDSNRAEFPELGDVQYQPPHLLSL